MTERSSTSVSSEKPKRILVVDDDVEFGAILGKSLTQKGYDVASAKDGKEAQSMLTQEGFDLVISDIRMPEMNGIELLKWVRAEKAVMPVILMTGFSEILETHEAARIGASGFLAKPFKRTELFGTIEACFEQKQDRALESEESSSLDSQFCKISIRDFASGHELKYDIFIRISESKYVKIAHNGEDIQVDRIETYKAKGITYLYLRKEDLRKYLDFTMVLAKTAHKSARVNQQRKIAFLKHASEVLMQHLYVAEIGRESFNDAATVVENALSLVVDSDDALDLLVALANHADFLHAHSLGVSLYSALIGRKLQWQSPATVFKLSLGGLLHDVGKKEIPREILEKRETDRRPEETALFESHPFRGAKILTQLQCVPTDVLQIVHEHHENCLGFGYPNQLKKAKIHPLSRVVAVANDFCGYAIKNPDSPEGMSAGEAIQRMLSVNPEYYDEDALRGLLRVFGLPEIGITKPAA